MQSSGPRFREPAKVRAPIRHTTGARSRGTLFAPCYSLALSSSLSFAQWLALGGVLLLALSFTSAYVQRMPISSSTLYLLLGLPGSGKTTAAQEITKLTGAVHLSSDSFRLGLFDDPQFTQDEHDALYKMLDYMCELLLKHGSSVVYDANLNRKIHRTEKYQLAKRLKADVALYWVQAPRALAKKRRLETQHEDLVPKNETPHDMFDRIADIFEAPGKDEPFTTLDGTKITAAYVGKLLGVKKA